MTATDELRRLLDERGVKWHLTAEQVRELMEDNSHDYPSPTDPYVFITEYDWQAIADELNAVLGHGECKKLPSDGTTKCIVRRHGCEREFGYWKCSACGCECFDGARYCMNCGAKVVEG